MADTPAIAALPPHAAALGMRFYAPPRVSNKTGLELGYDPAAFASGRFPVSLTNQILVAEHGSWNKRSLGG